MSKILNILHKFKKQPYDGDRIYFMANKKTDEFGFFTKEDVEDKIYKYGANNFIIFNTSDHIDIETEMRWLDE